MVYKIIVTLFLLSFGHFCEAQNNDTNTRINLDADFRIEDLSKRYADYNKGKKMDGYRIQLFSGRRDGAYELRKQFFKAFPDISSEVVYETPDYKVQAANCLTELEAEKYLQQIRTVFPGAFVVKAKITPPEYTFKLKEGPENKIMEELPVDEE